VKRLILVGTSAVLENAGDVEKRLFEALPSKDQEAYKAAQEGAFTPLERDRRRYRVLYPRCFYRPPDSQMLDRDTYYIFFDALARNHVLSSEPSMFDFRSQLSRIRVPSLVVAGKHDLVTPVSQAEALAKGLPSSRLAVMHNSGHFPYFEQATLFTEWVRGFINDTADANDDAIVTAMVGR
jgi:pimeloyl-ACP methyl ester carboxylesterase